MAGRVNWEANVSSNVREVLEYTDKLRGELEKLENGNYGIKLNIDEKRLASVISNLDKMLSSLGKGSGDFKQFENLSKELSGIISEVQNLSKAFGKVQDSGTKTLLSSIQNIDKSLSELSQHIINVNKNMGNIGGDTNGTVKQVENISNAYDNAAKSAEKLADAQSKIGNKSNISSENSIRNVLPSDSEFKNVIENLDLTKSKLGEIVKITRQAHADKDGKFYESFTLTDRNGSTETYGESSKTSKGQLLNYKYIEANTKAAEQEAKAVKEEWDKNVKAIQGYMDAVTKLNNLKAQDKGTGTKSNEIENQVKVIEELKEKALEARANISSMINPHSAPIEEWREYLDVMRLFEQAAFGSSESVAKLEDAIKNMNTSNLNALEKAGNTFKSQAFNLSIKPDDQHQFSSWVNKLKELNLKIDEYGSKVKYLKENNITDEEQIKEVEKLRDSIDETIKTMSKTPQANRGWTQISIDKTIQKMNDDLKENSGYSKETKRNIQALIEELKNIPDRPLSEILNDFYRFKREAHDAGREGKSFFAILKDKTIYGYAAQLASTYLSFTDMVRYVGQGIDAINEFDTGLTKISYTMDMTKSQLDDLGNSVLNMASDMKTSIDDAMSVAQIYANMNTSAEEIKKLSEPTLILSNLSGFDSATIADDIQAVTQQFEMAADESMHIADVYDYISRNIAVDYSKFWSLYWKQYNENKSKSVKTKLFYN